MNKKAFLDSEVFTSTGFWILTLLIVGGTIVGWIGSEAMGFEAMPLWIVLCLIPAEIIICYIFALKMQS